MGNMRFKVGDRVRIKSIDWYNENKDEDGYIDYGTYTFFPCMSKFCGKTFEIAEVYSNCYNVKESCAQTLDWTDEMIEGLVEEITNVMDEDKMLIGWIKEPNRYRLVPDKDYEIKYDEKGFFYLEKKKKEYPKTYDECVMQLRLGVVNELKYRNLSDVYKKDLIVSIQKLLICRDAYWKIAGEEMGLGRPWEPDWDDDEWPDMYYISWDGKCLEKEKGYPCCNMILIFPTEEMRDAFYENFKELINECKELL